MTDRRKMVCGLLALGIASKSGSPATGASPALGSLRTLYDNRLWFDLRERTQCDQAPIFFRAAAALAFDVPGAEALMRAVIDHDAAHRAEARSLLIDAYYRRGRYVEASNEAGRLLQETPTADFRNTQAILEALRTHGDQAVAHYSPSLVPMTTIETSFFLPVSINGVSARYAFDSGASMSLISRSEAQRLGLTVARTGSRTNTVTDRSLAVDVTSVPRLRIGDVELRNVGFFVFPDEQPPFDGLPRGDKGILGLPVLLALKTVSWSAAGRTFHIGGPARGGVSASNLAFDGSAMAVQARLHGRPLTFAFDTGARTTVLYSKFARAAPEAMRGARRTTHTLIGVGGASSLAARALLPFNLELGGRSVTMRQPTIVDGQSGAASAYYLGNLGMDLLNQARVTTIDFPNMALSLR